jgi:exosome complex exonuclease DIS3/RRP44
MLKSSSFIKKTKKGNVVKVVKEHYLRDDIYCGYEGCSACPSQTSLNGKIVVILDTNVILHQIDLLEHKTFTNAVILSTVLNEVKANNVPYYTRLRELIATPEKHFYVFSNEFHSETFTEKLPNESPNDRNDRGNQFIEK